MKHRLINYQTKGEIVFETLKDQIVSGTLKPGERISAGEVANRLADVGFEIRVLEWQDIEESMYLKCQIEKFAIKWAIERSSSENFAILRKLSASIRNAVLAGDKAQYYESNKDFHFSFCKIARANKSLDLYQKLWDYEGWYADQLRNTVDDMLLLCDDHDLLIDAVEARDLPKAQMLSDAHAEKCISILRNNLQRAGYFLKE